MKLKSIAHTLHSSTGQPVTIDLAKRQIITGKNRVGKTAILDAISLALTGYIPRLGKSGDKLEPVIGSCQEAQAIAEIESTASTDPFVRKFTITKKKDGSISKSASFDLKSPLTPLIIDSSLFLAAKASDRMAMIQSAAGVEPKRFAKLLSEINAKFPLVRQHFSKSTDIGEFSTETEANLSLAIKETKASLDRQKKAAAAFVEHATVTLTPYSESAHTDLRKLVKQLENTVASITATIAASEAESPQPVEPRVGRPQNTVAMIQNIMRDLAKSKGDKNQAARVARDAQDQLAKLDAAASVQECHCCGAKREHWLKADNSGERRKELQEIINSAPSDNDFDALEEAISDANQDMAAAVSWERYDDELAARKELDARRAETIAQSRALLDKSQAQLPGLQAELAAMELARDGFIAAKSQADQEKMIADTRDAMEKELEQLAEARAFIKAELTKLSNDMMIPILEKANLLLNGIMPWLVCANFRLGYEQDGQWVALEGFSGSEMAIATAALQAALMTQGDLKTIIIDEAQRIDPELLRELAHNIDHAIEIGVIEQAIIVGSRLDDAGKSFGSKSAWSTYILK